MIKFGPFRPDLPASVACQRAVNCVPQAEGYGPVKAFSANSVALPSVPLGSVLARSKTGASSHFAGTSSALYSIRDSLIDVSKSGGYSTSGDERWSFLQFGDTVLAANYTDNIQALDLSGGNFDDLAGNPPKARSMAIVGNQVILGNVFDNDGAGPARVWWSGFNDSTSWTPGTDQSDFYDLVGPGGWIQSIVGGEVGVIIQERAVWRMQYVGAPQIFIFDQIEGGVGTGSPNSVVAYGRNVFYLSDSGFMMLVDGTQSVPIGSEQVDRYFFNDIQSGELLGVTASVDPTNTLVLWSYLSMSGTYKLICYNWVTQSWSTIESDVRMLVNSASPGLTLEDLGSLYSSIEDVPFSLDSRAWVGGSLNLAGFDSLNRLGYFDGQPLTASIETPEMPLRGAMYVTRSYPLVDGDTNTTITQNVVKRNTLTDSVTVGPDLPLRDNGHSTVRSRSRHQRIRVNIAGGFDNAVGIDIDAERRGRR